MRHVDSIEGFDLQLFAGSGAGLNRVPAVLLKCGAAASATFDTMKVVGPIYAPQPGSGSVPPQPAGPRMTEAIAYSKWLFQLTSPNPAGTFGGNPPLSVSGWSVSVYGTIDMNAYYSTRQNPPVNLGSGYTFPDASWAFLESPSGGSSSNWPNPLTNVGQLLYVPVPLVAIRIVVTATSASSDISVLGFAIP